MSRTSIGMILAVLLASCVSLELPEGSGMGLVTWDREAPAGAETFPQPRWTPGDRYVYLRGNELRLPLRVEAPAPGDPAGAQWILVDEDSGIRVAYTEGLGELGQHKADAPLVTRVLAPMDAQFCWPLWVGKRWTCDFVSKSPGQDALPLLASYHCDARETVTTPAGSFDCLRIWRRAHVMFPGTFLERVTVMWYSPQAGYVVRRLDDGILLELAELQRQQ
ncbi:MAG: hypothetical protein EYC70_15515 [Planctomycetota bacterium]|nr:MAG: hypothetical protein EYC70_15515 [Planctomycetota bacterium]